jgi:hypothetical protein
MNISENGNISDGVMIDCEKLVLGQPSIQHSKRFLTRADFAC